VLYVETDGEPDAPVVLLLHGGGERPAFLASAEAAVYAPKD